MTPVSSRGARPADSFQGGAGATSFGAADDAQPPLSNDPQHNVLAAIVRWVEEGVAPDSFTAVHYHGGDAAQGVQFTRPICKVCLACSSFSVRLRSLTSFIVPAELAVCWRRS